jgi:hypothetical protein
MTPVDEAPPPPAWTFDALVREGRALIPVHAPAWTDHNPADPGITLLELLAYVTEVLAWRLARVTPQARLQLLRLLRGERWPGWEALREAPAAQVDHAIDLAVRELGAAECAVTANDFERLAAAAARSALGPGRPVRALCRPGVDATRPARPGSVRAHARAHVTVVLLPRDELDAEAMARLCARVREDLAPRCLLTTRLHVVAPVPLHVAIGARIAPRPDADRARVREAVAQALRRCADGGPVRLTRIAELIDAAEGVDHVEDVFVRSIGPRADTLEGTAARLGLQVGRQATPGVDARLGAASAADTARLRRDDAGRLAAIDVRPWETVRVHLARDAVHWIDPAGAEDRR